MDSSWLGSLGALLRNRIPAFTTGLAKLGMALVLLMGLPSNGVAQVQGLYTGSSVGSDGTVYGWGITYVPSPQPGMYHYNSVSGTLTSPNGRQVNGSGPYWTLDSSRYDISLPFDPNDTGTYLVESSSDVWCTAIAAYIVWHVVTQSQTSNAYPTNFHLTGSTPYPDGRLVHKYAWGSSSGHMVDLVGCGVFEIVDFPGPPGTYIWPAPWLRSDSNPTTYPNPHIPGSDGGAVDTQHTGRIAAPYEPAGFHTTQGFFYSCSWQSGALTTGIDIHREITQGGSTYTYTVTKSGGSASCTLGTDCENGN